MLQIISFAVRKKFLHNRICGIIKQSMILRKASIFIILILAVFLSADFVLAVDLEVPLPETGGGQITTAPILPDYVKYIFNFSIGIAGLIAFLMLVYGGFRYLTSAGNPSAMSDANSQIFASLIGLIVILGVWLLLTTINPQLIVLNPELKESGLVIGETPGVYLCAGENCQFFNSSQSFVGGEWNDKITSIKFSNTDDVKYGAVLHEEKYYRGMCTVCLGDSCDLSNIGNKTSSVHVFIQADSSLGNGVTLYETENYNRRCGEECYQVCSPPSSSCGDNCSGWIPVNPGLCWGPFPTSQPNLNTSKPVWSVEINEPGKWLAVLFKGSEYSGDCEVFTISDENTEIDNYLKRDNIGSLRVLPIKVMK